MKKPKVFIDKDNTITIIFGKEYDRCDCNVNLVHDRGVAVTKKTVFDATYARFVFHAANAYGDSGYCSMFDEWDTHEDTQYVLVSLLRAHHLALAKKKVKR